MAAPRITLRCDCGKSDAYVAYGDRWTKLGDWLKTVDPDRRMVNEFFADLLP